MFIYFQGYILNQIAEEVWDLLQNLSLVVRAIYLNYFSLPSEQ